MYAVQSIAREHAPRFPEGDVAQQPLLNFFRDQERKAQQVQDLRAWVALGKTNPEIGCILHISEFTVKNHLKSIFGKLDVTNRAQAAAKLARLSADA